MEEKITAVYLVVWNSELTPEDGGSYERPLEEQKKRCLEFMRKRGIEESNVAFYKRRSDLLMDIGRDRVARLIVLNLGRLGVNPGDIEGILFELQMTGVELLTVEGEVPGQSS